MAEQSHPGFERGAPQIEKVVQKIQSERETKLEERELVRASLKEIASAMPVNKTPVKPKQASVSSYVPSYVADSSTDPVVRERVEDLVRLALSSDLFKALEIAKRSSPFIEDAFHDAIIDYLVPELKRKGVLK